MSEKTKLSEEESVETAPVFECFQLNRRVLGAQILQAVAKIAGRQRYVKRKLPTGVFSSIPIYGIEFAPTYCDLIVGVGNEMEYVIREEASYEYVGIVQHSWWAQRSWLDEPINFDGFDFTAFLRIGDELKRILEGRPELMPIRFEHNGVIYEISPAAYTQNRNIMLPSGMILRCTRWIDSNPPQCDALDFLAMVHNMNSMLSAEQVLEEGLVLARVV